MKDLKTQAENDIQTSKDSDIQISNNSHTQISKDSDIQTSKKGRPKNGKRSNTNYVQTTAYIQKDTLKQTKIALINEDRDYSELIEDLLQEWLKN